MNVSQPDEEGRVTIQLSDGEETFGEQRVVKLPTAVSELDNDAGYLKEVDITIGLKDNTLTLTNATNEATSSVTLPSQLSEFENDEQFLRFDEMEFRIEDNSVLVLRRDDGSIVASVRLPEQESTGMGVPSGTNAGDLLYWHNNAWDVLPAGLEGQVLTFQSGGLAWSNPTVFDEQDLYQPGDIFVNSYGQTEGIVVSTDPMTRTGLLVALNDITSNWSNVNELIGADDPDNGLNNMAVVKAQSNWQAAYPVFAEAANIGSQWYIPSLAELQDIIASLDNINSQLSAAGGQEMTAGYYGSSLEHTSLNHYGVAAAATRLESDGQVTGTPSTAVIDTPEESGDGGTETGEGEDPEIEFHYELERGDTIFATKGATLSYRPVRVMSWTELNSKPIEGKVYRPGDIYYASDGQTALGVVYEVYNGGRNGKMISVEDFELEWCTLEEDSITRIGMDSDSGAENMSILATSEGYDAANYPAISKCTETTPWYMPSLKELKNAFWQVDAIQAALQSAGLDEIQTDKAYATSNEVSESDTTIYGVMFTPSEDLEGILDVTTTSLNKADKSLVRAIREF